MKGMKRRQFLTAMAGTAACFVGLDRAKASSSAPPQVPLGNTGITLSRVGQGTGMRGGNRQSNHTRMGFEKLVGLFRHSYDQGVTFFELADLYGSHVYFREALRFIPRNKVVILTKLWWRYDGNSNDITPAFRKRSAQMALERFRHELSTDYLDIVLLHCMMSPDWDNELQAYMEALAEAKEKKLVRAVGISSHNLGGLKTAARCPWVDVVLARINPTVANMDAKPDEVIPVLKEIKANGKALIGMKIYGEGTLAHMKDECIRFAQNLGLLDTMTVGAETPEQMNETLDLVSKYPAQQPA
jgi:aryl-alcohol dehydrogenase-like predicted oxidoreductase